MKTTHLLLIMLCAVLIHGAAEGTVYFNDGDTHTIDYTINDYVNISGADTLVTLANGGWVKRIHVELNGASFSMTGGYIEDTLGALSSSPVFITGGIIGNRIAMDSYGSEGADGDVYIYGSDFKINGQTTPYGVYHESGRISGTLANGDLLDCDFGCHGTNDLVLMPVPEPATLLLLGMGGLLMRKR